MLRENPTWRTTSGRPICSAMDTMTCQVPLLGMIPLACICCVVRRASSKAPTLLSTFALAVYVHSVGLMPCLCISDHCMKQCLTGKLQTMSIPSVQRECTAHMHLTLIPFCHTYLPNHSPQLSLGHVMNGQACKGVKKPTGGRKTVMPLFSKTAAQT